MQVVSHEPVAKNSIVSPSATTLAPVGLTTSVSPAAEAACDAREGERREVAGEQADDDEQRDEAEDDLHDPVSTDTGDAADDPPCDA